MFKLDPDSRYMMPAHFGPRPLRENLSFRYHNITSMAVPFITDRDKLAAYLPEPFEVAEHAVVTVTYACNGNVDFLAGHGYNMVSVNAAVVFNGENERLEGNYSLVVWENLTDPILVGREQQGIPKIYADIQDHSIVDGTWSTTASHFGHKILDLQIADLREPTAEELQVYGKAPEGKDNPMGWRYLAAYGGVGQRVSEYTTFPSQTEFSEIRLGQGRVDWSHLSWEQNPTQYHIVNALADLPVLMELPAMVAKGSADLRLPGRPLRVIG
ncbi:MAG: acetoacetate decarboxylase family protein [Halioglobus sp.]